MAFAPPTTAPFLHYPHRTRHSLLLSIRGRGEAASPRRLITCSLSPRPSPSPSRGGDDAPRTRVGVSTADVDYAPAEEEAPSFDFDSEVSRLHILRSRLSNSRSLDEKLRILDRDPNVRAFFAKSELSRVLVSIGVDLGEIVLLKCLVAAGQGHVLESGLEEEDWAVADSRRSPLRSSVYALAEMIENWDFNGGYGKRGGVGVQGGVDVQPLKKLLRFLGEVEQFYNCIGGIIGYQIMVLELLSPSPSESQSINWSHYLEETTKSEFLKIHIPKGLDLSQNTEYASQAALWGIEGLPELGEIYALGGSGDRLGLVDDDTGEALPAAMLPYCGKTLLEGLIRDLQAREFLYFKMYGKQCITPVAIMTSSAKRNHEHIKSLCERHQWFGRGQSSFRLFEQPLVPAISAEDGQWLVTAPFTPVAKPGGHGVIWKLAHDKGVFQWFFAHGRKGATVRQVSNVVAGTDLTMISLAGIGLRQGKKLGFASCKRKSGATEGINVLVEKQKLDGKWQYGVSCIEYTEFEKFGIKPASANSSQEDFPANTNILYIDLASAEKVGSSKNASCLPGMVLNLKKPVVYRDQFGVKHSIRGGRLEYTMQNIADNFLNNLPTRRDNIEGIYYALDTFIVCNERKRVTSSAKRKRSHADKSLRQTPDGSLLDVVRNAADLMSHCDIKIPKIESNEKYFHTGPPFLLLLHPALGPIWEVARQKFYGGSISKGSELQVEVAEFLWRNVQLDGSLLIVAENVIGSSTMNENNERILKYGQRCARCKLQNVKILNGGIDWNSPENVYWKHDVRRFEAVKIILNGNAEFEATDVTMQGNHVFEVPDGYKLRVTSGNQGLSVKSESIEQKLIRNTMWMHRYSVEQSTFLLEILLSSSQHLQQPL
ncbi:hypothetical protein Scep_005726 [Stephania cephalantha]|uniref:UGP3-like C-terminal hexapeptide repeats domain-containing protein n=1 Tax=Stephania cephalantha TaxID=152367 RepID=A0AAP0KWJ9_9MAGN